MINKVKKGYEYVKGTASELRDNSDYDRLVEMVGESGANQAIQEKLQNRGLTLEKWIHYREVRTIIHKSPLKVLETSREVDELSSAVLDA